MKLVATHRGVEAHRFAQEPLPYGAGWPEMADVAATIHIYELKPHEVYRPHYYLLLAYDAEGNRVGRKELGDGEWEE